MAFKESIDKRIQAVSASWKDITSKKMFGGVCYLTAGNMFCGVYKDWLILRLSPVEGERALESTHSRSFDITGRPMKG